MAAVIGIKGHCAHCDITFELKPWQVNAIAIHEPFECPYCQRTLQLNCPRQQRQFRSLDHWGMVRPSMIVLTCVVLIVALVAEWLGLVSVIGQLNISLVVVLVHFLVLRYARHRQRLTLDLQAVNPLPVEQLAGVAGARLGQQ
jgi:Flp pilus assembly protein TadB